MTCNSRAPAGARPAHAGTAPILLVGMPGAGKSAIGRRLAAQLGREFRDADQEIEAAAGQPITEIFARWGEGGFRDGERRVIARLIAEGPFVIATGGGAFADAGTRALIRRSGAVSVWLRCRLPTLLRRVAGRDHRPMFVGQDPEAVLRRLMAARHPCYAEADIVVECMDDSPEVTTRRVADAIAAWTPPQRLEVALAERSYPVLTGPGLIARAGAHLAPVLASRRVAIVTDRTVAGLHLGTLRDGLAEAGFSILTEIVVPPGESAKSFAVLGEAVEGLLAAGVDRRTAVVALGGGVVGDLAGFAAAVTLRGLPFVQVPTTLLAQVDSSVGGKTGINTPHGKNLAGAFHQPRIVLADTAALATLPARELRAGWAEVAKHGLLNGPLFAWCEREGPAAVGGDAERLAIAVIESCRLKAGVVAADEREESAEGGRALLNLGHTFGHAIEAELGFDGTLLHGEAVALGLVLAARLSALLGHAEPALAERIAAHLAAVGLPSRLAELPRVPPLAALLARMKADKKVRDGRLRFVLIRRPGDVFTAEAAEEDAAAVLAEAGAA
jgi:shikimate kinase/3-dehydroquinate synthase